MKLGVAFQAEYAIPFTFPWRIFSMGFSKVVVIVASRVQKGGVPETEEGVPCSL